MSTTDDPWEDPTTKLWVQHVLDEMVPQMESSAAVVSLVPGNTEGDVKFWVELGAAIMMDKPLMIVAFDGRVIPERLRAIADEVVVLPDGVTPGSSDELARRIEAFVKDP